MNTNWKKMMPYIIGSILFLIGGVRLQTRGDTIGAVIFSVTAIMAAFYGFVSQRQGSADSN